ncbi:alpha/beta fold hydrolase [Mycolicibacterium sp.]|uniref:alpha/beta hydrolase n=1 Tax=Mycolicibacterium sp. TaxID=2320850 RepID=UPI0028B17DB2|nr:alpha/beta fold hydrolase [Mycolicibacterium sp.]
MREAAVTPPLQVARACAVATAVASHLQAGDTAAVVAMLDSSIRDDGDDGIGELADAWQQVVTPLGSITEIRPPVCGPRNSRGQVVTVVIDCEHGPFQLRVTVDPDGMVTTLHFQPARSFAEQAMWTPPPYADPTTFTERDMMLESAGLAVEASLCIPNSAVTPVPAVVLLAGSGPTGRDSTVGPNKPLKDLAWGLASHGIATLRYDKITYAEPESILSPADFTAADEYIPHALAAINTLRDHPSIDGDRIYLLGHSQGATMAPRVAANADSVVAGLILMAVSAEPLHHAVVRQSRYILSLDPDADADQHPGLAALIKQAELVDSADLNESTPPEDLPFGVPAPYWLDLRTYDPIATVATLNVPVLLLQGGRDYQVTAEENQRFAAALPHHLDVTTHLYPAGDHYLFAGGGPSAPADYYAPQHVDPAVIADTAAWVQRW